MEGLAGTEAEAERELEALVVVLDEEIAGFEIYFMLLELPELSV